MPRNNLSDSFWSARPVLQQVRHLANCKGQSPWPLLGWLIVRTLHTVPYSVPYESVLGKQSLNSLVGISGPTGAGKTISYRHVEDHFVFRDNNPERLFGSSWQGLIPPGSGESMPDYYVEYEPEPPEEAEGSWADIDSDRLSSKWVWKHSNHAGLFFFDEVGMMKSRDSRQGSTLVEYMKEGWSGSVFGRTLASGKGVVLPAGKYRFACVVNTQPKRAGILFSEEAIAGGLQGRFLWFDVTADINREAASFEPVEKIVLPTPDWVGVESVRALDVMNTAHFEHHWNALDGLLSETESHSLLTRSKVAVALAVLDGRAELDREDWELSEVVMEHTSATREHIEEVLAEEAHRAVVADGRKASVRAVMTEEAKHEQRVRQVAASIYRNRERTGRKKPQKNALSSSAREFLDEALEFLDSHPDWKPPS